jgi:hypothetical protein
MREGDMAETDRFRQVDDEFKLHDEVLVVVTDADGGAAQAQAVVFWREGAGNAVNELEPTSVDEALDQAKQTALRLGRQVVVQLEDDDIWWPHWGTLEAA